MARHQVRRLPVVENGRLVGIVAQADIALRENEKRPVSSSRRSLNPQRKSVGSVTKHSRVSLDHPSRDPNSPKWDRSC